MVQIRFADVEDVAGIRELATISWKETYQDIYPMSYIETCLHNWYSQETIERACLLQDKVWHGYLVAESDERIVAYLGAGIQNETGFIYSLYVHPAYHRHGIATALLAYITDYQKKVYMVRKQELNVAKNNLRAITFYEQKEFQHKRDEQETIDGEEYAHAIYERII